MLPRYYQLAVRNLTKENVFLILPISSKFYVSNDKLKLAQLMKAVKDSLFSSIFLNFKVVINN